MGVLHHTPDTRRAVSEVFRVLRPGGRVILMFYHRNSPQYRVKFPFMRLIRGKSIQESINEVDGVGNPKGDVYSRAELGRLLEAFDQITMFAGVMPWHAARPLAAMIPQAAKDALARRWGWFLYAKGIRP
jgi:SAM-dependent methyltransferase